MKIKSISFPTSLDMILDKDDDNLDVFVELEDGVTYTIVVATPMNLYKQMFQEEKDYIPPGQPQIIVNKLDEETILEAIKVFVGDDAYWLRVYYLASDFDKSIIDEMAKKVREIQESL